MSGLLVYLIGPSGAGKDSVLMAAEPALTEAGVRVAQRTITRPAGADEDNLERSIDDFERSEADGAFALSWQAHGNRYGIGAEIDDWLEAGKTVIVNGSRAHLPVAATRYGPRLRPVLVTATVDVLAERLAGRGRESSEQQRARVARSAEMETIDHPGLIVIDNSGRLDDAVTAFVAAVLRP
ncbi:MAG: phosphonate metabolism protein/1,5-bisphosphokinase (PRPP-forming) PhnN [Actinomycetota bacterium]